MNQNMYEPKTVYLHLFLQIDARDFGKSNFYKNQSHLKKLFDQLKLSICPLCYQKYSDINFH
jgi:hypothetical protein